MSKEVKRYVPEHCESGGEIWAEMQEDSEGGWVRASDYEALLAERDALRDALEDATHQIRSSLNLLKCDDEFIAKQLTKARAALQGAQS